MKNKGIFKTIRDGELETTKIEYNSLTYEKLLELIKDLTPKSTDRKIVAWTIDKADGVFKNLEDTQQFREALEESIRKDEE